MLRGIAALNPPEDASPPCLSLRSHPGAANFAPGVIWGFLPPPQQGKQLVNPQPELKIPHAGGWKQPRSQNKSGIRPQATLPRGSASPSRSLPNPAAQEGTFLLPESRRFSGERELAPGRADGIEDLRHLGSLRPSGSCLKAPPSLWGCKNFIYFSPHFFPYLSLLESFTTIKPLPSNKRLLCFAVPHRLLDTSQEGEPQKLITAPSKPVQRGVKKIPIWHQTHFIIRFEALQLSPGFVRWLPGKVQL